MQLYQEDAEITQMIKDENQHLKKTVLAVTKEKDELQAQISSKLQAYVLENSSKATLEQRLESLIKSKND